MKNLLTLLLAFGFVLGMTACGGTTATEGDAAEATEAVESSAADAMEETEVIDSTAVEAEEPIEGDDDGSDSQ